jgi:hypothetical protein
MLICMNNSVRCGGAINFFNIFSTLGSFDSCGLTQVVDTTGTRRTGSLW